MDFIHATEFLGTQNLLKDASAEAIGGPDFAAELTKQARAAAAAAMAEAAGSSSSLAPTLPPSALATSSALSGASLSSSLCSAGASPSLELLESDSCNKEQDPRFKTEICRNFKEHMQCEYGEQCQFAHGKRELRSAQGNAIKDSTRNNKYKTKLCQKYWLSGYCAYGPRCNFLHNERLAAMAFGASPELPICPENNRSNKLPNKLPSPVSTRRPRLHSVDDLLTEPQQKRASPGVIGQERFMFRSKV